MDVLLLFEISIKGSLMMDSTLLSFTVSCMEMLTYKFSLPVITVFSPHILYLK